jgi:hypothetical protein
MEMKQFMRPCKVCAKATMHIQSKPNHVLHLLLTIFTLGVWLIIWILVGLLQGKPQCTVCGNSPGLFGT